MKLEICVNSYQSAKNAQDAGAHRIELCSELTIGGTTPSYGLLKKVTEELTIETFVLIRPRSGNFTYSNEEFEIIKANIKLCKELGASGIVSGVLNADSTIDITRTKELIELSKPLQFTFHRAFDYTPNPEKALQQLIDLGADRVLTSGQEVSVDKGIEILKVLNEKSNNKIVIMPGGGISIENINLFKIAGFKEIHTSASKVICNTKSNSFFGNVEQTESSIEKIKAMLENV